MGKFMSDKAYIASIAKMTESQLLDIVMAHPEYILDSYYRAFGIAIENRYRELRANR